MIREIKDKVLNLITSRVFILMLVFLALFLVVFVRIFNLQIVKGASYLENFTLMIQKDQSIQASRGIIYDRNGNVLAYNELAYSVEIEDVYESSSDKNQLLNQTIYELVTIIEGSGDEVVADFEIVLNDNNEWEYAVTGTTKERFLADVYGYSTIEELKEVFSQYTATAEEVILYLAGSTRYEIGAYEIEPDSEEKLFLVGFGYTEEELLKILTVRYSLSKNEYQKFISTTVATEVSENSVAMVLENIERLDGVSIEEDTIRRYVDSIYFSHILGYTGNISQTELDEANTLEINSDNPYTMNDSYGKAGIEKVMESDLRGVNGSEIVHVDKLGTTIETSDYVDPIAGNNLYLTIDKDLQIATYQILEQKIAGILISNIVNIKESSFSESMISANNISIDDVYFAVFNNNILSISALYAEDASEIEQQTAQTLLEYEEQVLIKLREELETTATPYNQLTTEYKVYQSYLTTIISDLFFTSNLDTSDQVYIDWRTNETISLQEYLLHAIAMNWIDITVLDLEEEYLDKDEIYMYLIDYILNYLDEDSDFMKKMIDYMIQKNEISGQEVCLLLWEQEVISVSTTEIDRLKGNQITPYQFMIERLENLEITPAQLALDPCSGSCVITDVNSGEVLALVSYPSYDNNRMNDATYYKQLNNDLSNPLWNYATQQKTAPGSTFKMVSSAALLEEHVVSVTDTITCYGIFDDITPSIRCWIYPQGTHGAMNIASAIANSCNYYYYQAMFNLCLINNQYNSDYGIEILSKYATLFGLDETSGVEIMESVPQVSDDYAIPSAIGQGSHNYTTVGLARYVTAVANKGTTYNLSLIDCVTDINNNLVMEYTPEIDTIINFNPSTWEAIHQGMYSALESKSYFQNIGITVAGKTGTAQENLSRPDHSLFVGFAPYETPEIAVATRIANGYTSNYAAEATKDVIMYYFGLEDEEELISGTATAPETSLNDSED
ncbi:MAG: penicillin-binding transpeptidase domain-containing protein [Eubacteriales bacterium]